ncbi:MAG TPA: sigma-54 dependent transcriptional regulator [Candidatus Xenobia bacterium]|nr:sigma-54 dependent transcriptional regulator [Candidatus Xenobia bacterium]
MPNRRNDARAPADSFVLLVADDDPTVCEVCRDVAEPLGLKVIEAGTAEQAQEQLEQRHVDLVLADLRLPDRSGMELLERIKRDYPEIAVILMTGYGSIELAVDAIKRGAYDYLAKPFHVDDLRAKLQNALRAVQLAQENRILREQASGQPGFGGLVGTSREMQRVYRLIAKVSESRHPVLILGESGTGKEIVARSIHYLSPRRDKPFVPVDCAGLVPTLIESELFGYVKGAFTGAVRPKQGLLEMAQGGTIFLDEIAELSPELQARLLRAIQEKEIKPVGGTHRVPLDARILAATNRDLDQAIRDGRFRQDLFYRLNVVTLRIPPLRERKSDIPLLVNYFLERYRAPERPLKGLSEEAMARLMSYDWPGNVRELENVIERAVALGAGSVIHTVDLPTNLQSPALTPPAGPGGREGVLPLRELEKRAILHALQELGGDKLAAARLLGIGKTTLYRKLKEYNLEP